MNAKHDRDSDALPEADASAPRNASRRRFARAGLAAPVVLSSLASKPVLGAAPYHCTVSGQASGTLSRQGALEACQTGDSRSTWLMAADWSAASLVKGSMPNSGCNFSGSPSPSLFNGFTVQDVSLKAAFWGQSGSGSCTLVTTNTGKPASMLQILANNGSDSTTELGRVIVVSLLNALKYAPNYGATPAQVISMFNAVYPSGSYHVAGRIWGRAEVVAYLKLLYPPDTVSL